MTKSGKVTATIFTIIAFGLTAFAGFSGNMLAMGGWLMATVLVIVICVNAEDYTEKLQEKGELLLNVDEKTIDWNRAVLQIAREERRTK